MASHQRCRDLGVNPAETRNPRQKKLTQEELRCACETEFLALHRSDGRAVSIRAGYGFVVNIAKEMADLLDIIGDTPILDKLKAGNCSPAYRRSEKMSEPV